ncbi:MAG: LacI family DNA-binding transcriptional regulator [Planctomycetota bacterium]|jgi:LacI family transcriptional regulator|nr:LacI family DNA-binding transcriptional regulator [Planctomycetota bacterium]
MAVTQRDIAEHLGIGQRTVSRAFGSGGALSADVRERILRAADVLGYQPHLGARAMRTGRTGTALLVQGCSHASNARLAPDLYGALHDALVGHDLALGLARIGDEGLSGAALPDTVSSFRADGLLVSYETNTPDFLPQRLRQLGLPAVWLNRAQAKDAVYFDDQAGAALAVGDLIARCSSVAYIDVLLHHTPHRHASRDHRLAGARAAAMGAGRKLHECLPLSERDAAASDAVIQRMLQDLPKPIGVLGYGHIDLAAVSVAALRMGLEPGRDLHLAMIADEEPILGVPVTWYLLDSQALAQAAAQLLADRLANARAKRKSRVIPITRPL